MILKVARCRILMSLKAKCWRLERTIDVPDTGLFVYINNMANSVRVSSENYLSKRGFELKCCDTSVP